jgi:hypothetical protein
MRLLLVSQLGLLPAQFRAKYPAMDHIHSAVSQKAKFRGTVTVSLICVGRCRWDGAMGLLWVCFGGPLLRLRFFEIIPGSAYLIAGLSRRYCRLACCGNWPAND